MKTHVKMVLIFTTLSVMLTASCFAESSAPLKIKGFYIGMEIDAALNNFLRLGFEGLSVRENQYRKAHKYYAISPGSGDPFKVETGLDERKVTKIYFSPGISDRLFGTHGINAEMFKEAFAKAYGLQPMAPYRDNPGAEQILGWEMNNLSDGYRIRIDLNKTVEIIRIARESEFSFD